MALALIRAGGDINSYIQKGLRRNFVGEQRIFLKVIFEVSFRDFIIHGILV